MSEKKSRSKLVIIQWLKLLRNRALKKKPGFCFLSSIKEKSLGKRQERLKIIF